MNDDDYKIIGETLNNLLFEEDIARIGNLLYHASRTNSETASRLYSETFQRFAKAAKILREVRARQEDI
ncbi:MAG: hypothetical protein V7L27_19355 [Nostoc sp.]|uniref:hypothetical protein n=1 Tax=Nostoc sp. TaxID=1180 RepID=UPI002FF67729